MPIRVNPCAKNIRVIRAIRVQNNNPCLSLSIRVLKKLFVWSVLYSHTDLTDLTDSFLLLQLQRSSQQISVSIRIYPKIFVRFEKLLPVGQWVFDESRVQKQLKSVSIRVSKIFVLFEKLLPVGQWVFDESRVQKQLKSVSIRVSKIFVLNINPCHLWYLWAN